MAIGYFFRLYFMLKYPSWQLESQDKYSTTTRYNNAMYLFGVKQFTKFEEYLAENNVSKLVES